MTVTIGNSVGASASAAATTVLTGFTATSVEKIALTATGSWAGSTTTFDASTSKDATEFWSDGSGRAVIFGAAGDATQAITKNAAIGLKNTTQDVTATFADTLVSGTADTGTLALGGAVGSSAAQPTVTLNGVTAANGFETINVVSTGSANRIAQLNSGTNKIETVNLTGSANVRIDNVNSTALKSVDASGLTGGAGANINAAVSTSAALKFVGSAGADRVVLNNATANAANTFSLNGGEGKDTIAVGTITNIAGATALQTTVNKATGFEVFEATAAGVTALQANLFTNINEFVFIGGGAVNLAVTGVETADKFTVGANQSGAAGSGTATLGTQALTFTGAAPGQTVDLVLSSATAAVAITGGAAAGGQSGGAGANAGAAIGFGGAVTTLKIDSSGSTANTITGGQGGNGANSAAGGAAAVAIDNGTSVQSVVITGSQNLSILGGSAGTAGSGSGETAGAASVNAFSNSISVDATGLQAKLTIAGSAQNDVIKVGTKGSEVRATDGSDSITLGAGNDVVVYTNASQSLTDATNSTTILSTIDKIQGWGAGVDKISVAATTLPGTGYTAAEFVAQNVVQAAVNAVAPTTLLQAAEVAGANIGANKIGVFQYDGNTYVLGNDGTAGTIAAGDLLVQITGLQTLTADNFVFA